MTTHIAPNGRIEWPRWHPERHPTIQHTFGEHRRLAGLLALAVVAAVAIAGASAAFAPVHKDGPATAGTQFSGTVGSQGLSALRKVFDPAEIQGIAAVRNLATARQEDRILDRQLKGQATVATIDPNALAASQAEERSLDGQIRALKSGTGTVTVTPLQTTLPGKPLPL